MKSIFARAAIRSLGVVTHSINITAVCSVGTLVYVLKTIKIVVQLSPGMFEQTWRMLIEIWFCIKTYLVPTNWIRKTCPHWLKDSPTGQKSSDHHPPPSPRSKEIGQSRMHVAWTTPAGCHANTEPSNKDKQLSKIPRNTVRYQGYLTLKTQSPASWKCQYKTPSPPTCF